MKKILSLLLVLVMCLGLTPTVFAAEGTAFAAAAVTDAALAAPKLTGISSVSGGVRLTWNAVSGAAKYRVFRKTAGGSWQKLADVTALTYTDTAAAAGVQYTYTVRCVNAAGTAYTSAYDKTGLTITPAQEPAPAEHVHNWVYHTEGNDAAHVFDENGEHTELECWVTYRECSECGAFEWVN